MRDRCLPLSPKQALNPYPKSWQIPYRKKVAAITGEASDTTLPHLWANAKELRNEQGLELCLSLNNKYDGMEYPTYMMYKLLWRSRTHQHKYDSMEHAQTHQCICMMQQKHEWPTNGSQSQTWSWQGLTQCYHCGILLLYIQRALKWFCTYPVPTQSINYPVYIIPVISFPQELYEKEK